MKRNDKYLYPAIFTFEDGYEIAVTFPDLPGCSTSGANEAEAFAMAREALGGHLWCMESDNEEIPLPTPLSKIKLDENEQAILFPYFEDML